MYLHTLSEMKIQGYFELKKYQKTEIAEMENTRIWLTNVYVGNILINLLEVRLRRTS